MSIADERLPKVEQLREKYCAELNNVLTKRRINVAAMARDIGLTKQQLYNIKEGRSYPSQSTHQKINIFLNLELPYVGKYKHKP